MGAMLALAVPAAAQEGRYTWRGTIVGTVVYDDNIYFERDDRQDGAVMRFRPALSGGYRVSPDLSLDGSYSFDADYYPSQPDLNGMFASQAASLGGRYRLGARTEVSVCAQHSRSATAADLIGGSGLELGRLPGTAWGFNAGASRRISKGGSLGLDYSHQTVSFGGIPRMRAQSVGLSWTPPSSSER